MSAELQAPGHPAHHEGQCLQKNEVKYFGNQPAPFSSLSVPASMGFDFDKFWREINANTCRVARVQHRLNCWTERTRSPESTSTRIGSLPLASIVFGFSGTFIGPLVGHDTRESSAGVARSPGPRRKNSVELPPSPLFFEFAAHDGRAHIRQHPE